MKVEKLVLPAIKGFAGLCCAGLGAMGFLTGGHRGGLKGLAILTCLAGSGAVMLKQAGHEATEVLRGK